MLNSESKEIEARGEAGITRGLAQFVVETGFKEVNQYDNIENVSSMTCYQIFGKIKLLRSLKIGGGEK